MATHTKSLAMYGALLGALVGLATPARGDVFMRLGRGTQALEQLGGVSLYQSDMRINGQPGKLAVYGFDSPPPPLAPDLRQALAMPDVNPAAAAAMVTRIKNGKATTLLLLPGAGTQNSLAILLEQSETALRATRTAPTEWPGRLAYPDATLLFTAENEQTRTTLAVATTHDTPESAAARMENLLRRDGWALMPPLHAMPALTIYAQGTRICAFSALAPETPNGQTRITLLQRLGTTP